MVQQGKETDPVKRKALVDQMQQLAYDQAPYHVLFYDAALHAYRTDKFGGWTLQPTEGGLPFFAYGARDYSLLTAPEPAATPEPSLQAPASGGPGSSTAAGGVASPAPEPRAVERSEQRQHAAADRRGAAAHRGGGGRARPAARSNHARGGMIAGAPPHRAPTR